MTVSSFSCLALYCVCIVTNNGFVSWHCFTFLLFHFLQKKWEGLFMILLNRSSNKPPLLLESPESSWDTLKLKSICNSYFVRKWLWKIKNWEQTVLWINPQWAGLHQCQSLNYTSSFRKENTLMAHTLNNNNSRYFHILLKAVLLCKLFLHYSSLKRSSALETVW